MKNNIEEIKQNNELFANALTYKIVWKSKFIVLLTSWGYERKYIDNYTQVIEKFLLNYENKVIDTLQNLKK